jgi:short-subunit dehydrogenase
MAEQYSFVVTGANSFLGRTFAKKLSAKNNYKLFLTSRSQFDFGELLNNKNISYLPGIDLTDEKDADRLKNEVDKFLPDKFHIINCLGYFPGYETIEAIGTSDAKKVFDSNILALYSAANNLLPLMVSRGGGHFIGFSTHSAYQNYPKMVAFTAAKVAVESIIRGIANEYLEKGVIANAIALATLLTEVEIKMKPRGDKENWLHTEEVCEVVENMIMQSGKLVSGNVIHIYKHSNSYFHQSYFDRINSK